MASRSFCFIPEAKPPRARSRPSPHGKKLPMTSSAMAAEQADDMVTAAARALSGTDAVEVTPAAGGGNNRVFRVQTEAGTRSLKSYPDDADPRDRLGVEFSSLLFLKKHGVVAVPAALASAGRCA